MSAPTQQSRRIPGLSPLRPDDPEHVGPHRLIGRLGAGGMGVVYGALDPNGVPVAVKTVHARLAADRGFRARFAREVDLVSRVDGLCTPRFLGADVAGEVPWMATEYVPGPTLKQRVQARGPLTGEVLRAFAVGTAEALRAVHAQGIVHRDLKPANVILAPDGPKVLDFGIARALGETVVTRTGGLFGTPGWVAPELYAGADPTPAADLFAWGAMVVFAATGRDPFGQGEADTLAYRVAHEEPDTTGVPAELIPVVTAALAKDPASRPTADRAMAELVGADPTVRNTRVLLGASWKAGPCPDLSAWGEGPIRRSPTPGKRGRGLLVAVAAVTALGLVAGGAWWAGSRSNPDVGGEEAPVAEAETEDPAEVPDHGGINVLSGSYEELTGVVGLSATVADTVQLYRMEEGPPGTAITEEGEIIGAITLSARREGNDVVVRGEGVYGGDAGDMVLHSRDVRADVLPPGFLGGDMDTDEIQVFTPEEDGVLLVLSPDHTRDEFEVTFEGLPDRSALNIGIPGEYLNGVESYFADSTRQEVVGIAAEKCLASDAPEGETISPLHQAGDCDPAWFTG